MSKAIYWRHKQSELPRLTYRCLDGATVDEFVCGHGYEAWSQTRFTPAEIDANPAYERCNVDGTWFIIQCSMCDCQATAFVHWGRDFDKQSANLCPKHLREVWDKIQPQLKAGIFFWVQGNPQTLFQINRTRESLGLSRLEDAQ